MTEEININTEVSKLLSSALARAKIVRDNLQLTKFYAHITEYLVATLHGKHFIQTGSCMEQSLIPGSDVDQMQIFSDTCAADSPNQVMIKKCHLLIMDTDDSRHGFSKLRLNHLLDKKDLTRQILEESLVCGEANSEYISSNRFSASFLKLRSATFEFSPFGPRTTAFFRHGPCSTIELDHSQQADIAVGIECANWPREAKEWCTRPRFYGWPSKNTVSALSKLPCYLLPVGDECSTNCALEWRFAFVPTERELIWEFSDTQIQCYVILKLLRKKFLEPIAPDQLSSFFLKTIVFWEIENKGPDAWTSENLIHCIVSCLQSLRECVMTKTLPHYIFRKRNLLFTKFRDREIQTAVVNKLEDLEKNTAPYVLQAATGFAPLDDLGKIWSNCKGSLACFINTRREQMLHIPELLEKTHRSYYYGRFIFIRIVGVRQQLEKLIEAGLYITEHESEFDSLFRKHALSCLKIEIGKRYIPEIFNPDTELPKTKLITTIYNLFAGATIGSTIGCLHLATLHYLLREYTKALTIIHSLISKKGHLFFIGLSAEKISLEEQNYPECIDVCPTLENLVAHDIYFSSEDVVWAPPGVGLECALLGKRYNWNFCVFHPLVYSYYLLFLICLKRKQVKECKQCLQEFSDFLSFDGGKIDRHRSLNLLGFCNYKLGYYDKAVSCFGRSLQIVGPVGNAASYHICILITELLTERTCRRAKDEVIYTRTSGPK